MKKISVNFLLLAMLIALPSLAARKVETLIVSCIDYRLRDELETSMSRIYGKNSYDEIALPGAGLGILNDQFRVWNTAFKQQLDVAINLHNIKKLIIVDHEDCGAYKTILKSDEVATHEDQMRKVREFIKTNYPDLSVETYLLQLDGHLTGLGKTKTPE